MPFHGPAFAAAGAAAGRREGCAERSDSGYGPRTTLRFPALAMAPESFSR